MQSSLFHPNNQRHNLLKLFEDLFNLKSLTSDSEKIELMQSIFTLRKLELIKKNKALSPEQQEAENNNIEKINHFLEKNNLFSNDNSVLKKRLEQEIIRLRNEEERLTNRKLELTAERKSMNDALLQQLVQIRQTNITIGEIKRLQNESTHKQTQIIALAEETERKIVEEISYAEKELYTFTSHHPNYSNDQMTNWLNRELKSDSKSRTEDNIMYHRCLPMIRDLQYILSVFMSISNDIHSNLDSEQRHQDNLNTLEENRAALESKINELKTKLSKLTNQLENSQKQADRVSRLLNITSSFVDKIRIDQLSRQIFIHLSNKYENLNNELYRLNPEIERLKQESIASFESFHERNSQSNGASKQKKVVEEQQKIIKILMNVYDPDFELKEGYLVDQFFDVLDQTLGNMKETTNFHPSYFSIR